MQLKPPKSLFDADLIKKYLFTGLLIWIPLIITLWVLALVVGLMDQTLMLLPDRLHPRVLLGVHIPGLGVILTLAVLLGTGVLAANYFGAWLFKSSDWLLSRIPLFKIVYNSVKQVSDTLLSSSGEAFSRSVLVPYPHPGVWALGFVTGTPPQALQDNLSDQDALVSVYVPTSPSPASGYVIMVPESLLRPSGLSVDEALKYIVSLGVVAPSEDALNQPIKQDSIS
ncbi:MAG TPA: DUF502 domain-containing protein [Limnobacter sp.]|nr:DUF502 domain-containing protein [Limnobacter sp.]